ncbi:hypothetical protein [Extensimonas vulgaris]|uniref:Uncharacterized protein n=1 Tax=Extensimonas vulgaris TaxID=1031594 RepID=A0A369AS24_9BURK|nr:hypothetical protein [Extensimonas vulgaris]RCX11056.1 hypothetical protein DFR45_102459 [Extensimonas vulgaris]TWI41730.1 hypothetical protein IP95_00490 [Extensimonas vulgaris]TXD16194.1 hypothetical protein FUT63_04990 [Extensimonas vulgaris]
MPISAVDRSPPWRPQGADLYSSGASGAPPVRPVNTSHPVESTDGLGQGSTLRTPDASQTKEVAGTDGMRARRDGIETPAEKEQKAKEQIPPQPPLYQQLIDFIQSMWRASSNAVEVAQSVHQTAQQERLAQQVPQESPTYSAPKVKRSSGS